MRVAAGRGGGSRSLDNGLRYTGRVRVVGLDVFQLDADHDTHNVAAAIDKLECVDEAEQRRQTADARRRWREELARDWGSARAEILAATSTFKTRRLDRRLVSDVRALERQVAWVDRDVGLDR